MATGPLAAGFADADRHPPEFDPATGTSPCRIRCSTPSGSSGTASGGGSGCPPSWAATACPPTRAVGRRRADARREPGRLPLPGRAGLRGGGPPPGYRRAAALGRAHDRSRLGRRRWCSPSRTPDPTSAPGAPGRCAKPDGRWHLEGVKRFITSAEHDLTENIVHLVLARPEGPASPRPAPRGCRCSWCPSGTSTRRPASSASATACSSPTSSTRWASRPPPPAS